MYSILNCLLFLLVQITQDAVLYTCRFPGTATSLGSAKDCPVPQAFEELEQCTVQQCQQCQSLSMGVQHNFGTFLPHKSSFHHKSHKTTFSSPSSRNKPPAGWLCDAVAPQLFTWTHRLLQPHLKEEQQRFLPDFRLILPCAPASPGLGGLQGCIHRWEGAASSQHLEGLQGKGTG